jgi:hypothetical protein
LSAVKRAEERKLAGELFNRVWELMEKPKRSGEDEDEECEHFEEDYTTL